MTLVEKIAATWNLLIVDTIIAPESEGAGDALAAHEEFAAQSLCEADFMTAFASTCATFDATYAQMYWLSIHNMTAV